MGEGSTFARTREGIRLGMNYRDVLKRYGWPDRTDAPGPEEVHVFYEENNNIAFRFDKLGERPYKVNMVTITRAE